MEGSIQNKFNTLKEPARHLKVWIEPGSFEFISKVDNYFLIIGNFNLRVRPLPQT